MTLGVDELDLTALGVGTLHEHLDDIPADAFEFASPGSAFASEFSRGRLSSRRNSMTGARLVADSVSARDATRRASERAGIAHTVIGKQFRGSTVTAFMGGLLDNYFPLFHSAGRGYATCVCMWCLSSPLHQPACSSSVPLPPGVPSPAGSGAASSRAVTCDK